MTEILKFIGDAVLLEFGFKNFFSFKEGVSISLKLDSNCPAHISKSKSFTSLLCVKGANGSGKTHILKGLAFIAFFNSNSFSLEPDADIPIFPFYKSDDPSEFYIEFSVEETCYLYELKTTTKEVVYESLHILKPRKKKIFERKGNEIVSVGKNYDELKSIRLRKNASIVSTANQYGLELLIAIHGYFNSFISNVAFSGMNESPVDMNVVTKYLYENSKVFEFVKNFIIECDVGISDIKIVVSERGEGKNEYFPIFLHINDDIHHPVTSVTESSGTKALFRNLGYYKLTLDNGGVLILDEFDNNLHPFILPKLLDLFFDESINRNQAQLVFTTHNSEILNYLGKYRTYLVNKENNESYAYRLDEIPGDLLRNDRPILPAYLDRKIGGVPKI